MKKLILALLMLTACTCANESVETKNVFDDVARKRDHYVRLFSDANPYTLISPCDGLTFVGLFDSFGSQIDIFAHEYPSGQWHRDVRPCYPDRSRSEISLENMLGALHAIWTRKNRDAMQAIFDYGEANDWVMGEGPKEYTRMPQIKDLLLDMLGYGEPSKDKSWDISGYKKHVIADYIYLKGRVEGKLSDFWIFALKTLRNSNKNDPVFHALYQRFKNGDQSTAIHILNDENLFPSDRLPDNDKSPCDWQEMPAALCLIYTTAIIEGK